VQCYTLAQLEVFAASIARTARHDARLALITARAAQAGDKQFKKILKEFS
jgi:hypothetical protein